MHRFLSSATRSKKNSTSASSTLRILVRRLLVVVATCALFCAWSTRASAHAFAPSLLDIRETAPGRADVLWKTPRARPSGSTLEPVLPESCARTSEPTSTVDATSVFMRWTIECATGGGGGLASATLGARGLDVTSVVVRVTSQDGRLVEGLLSARNPTMQIAAAPRKADVLLGYARLGVEHILGGADHLLFVFGLLLLVKSLRSLLATITSFTVGHSITLSLTILGYTEFPARLIEWLIALSVLSLAFELARNTSAPTWARRFPWVMAILFGMLHGLGFATALREAGLPAGEIPLALLSFNVGIEGGQILFVTTALAALRLLRPLRTRSVLLTRAPTYAMGALATYWTIERTLALLG